MAAAHNDTIHIHFAAWDSSAGIRVVGLLAFCIFGVFAAIMGVVYGVKKFAKAKQAIAALALFVGCLAIGWLYASMNTLVLNDANLGRVILNAFTWNFTLMQLVSFFGVDERAIAANYRAAVWLSLLFLSGGVLSPERTRFVALIAILPLALAVVLVATVWAARDKSLLNPLAGTDFGTMCGGPRLSSQRVFIVALGVVGIYTLICEALSREYSGVASPTAEFALMFVGHCAQVVLWTWMTFPEEGGSLEGTVRNKNNGGDEGNLVDGGMDGMLRLASEPASL